VNKPPHSVPSGIIDNYRRSSIAQFLEEHIQQGSKLSIVSAYFTIYAYKELKEKLDSIDELRFIFGEPRFIQSIDPEKQDEKTFGIEDEGLTLKNRLIQKKLAHECSEWINNKVQIRSIRESNLMHGKMYHIEHEGVENAILGSSNFTLRGIGRASSKNNLELNLIVDSTRDRDDLKSWFVELWEDENLVEDVKGKVLEYLSRLYRDNSPEFIYYKTLYHIFSQYLSEQEADRLKEKRDILITETQIWNALFEFQKDGVKGAIRKIQNYNGCILADSVGLGKTYEALAVIKYFELQMYRVLVLCPKKLRENWTVYQAATNNLLNPFIEDRFSYTVLSHTDLSRFVGHSGDIDLAAFNWSNYDLVVIDESHNFRNNSRGKQDEEGNIIRVSRYERLMEEIIKKGVRTSVLLLSATPVNNSLLDLRNQIYFFTANKDDFYYHNLGVSSLHNLIVSSQRTILDWVSKHKKHPEITLQSVMSPSFFKLLDGLSIARSRKHIQRYYPDLVIQLGGFPNRLPPKPKYPNIDLKNNFPTYDNLYDQISDYKLSLFKPSFYLKEGLKSKYDQDGIANFTQQDRENFLTGMMKVNFLKRLESSIYSFTETMRRTLEKIEEIQEKIKVFQSLQSLSSTIGDDELQVPSLEDEELRDALQVGRKLEYKLVDINVDKWMEDLQSDYISIENIYLQAKAVTKENDAKLAELRELIAEKVSHPTTSKKGKLNRKVLVFTAFADTSHYLFDSLRAWARDDLNIHIAMVTGGTYENKTTFGSTDFNMILTNFSPISKMRERIPFMPQDEEIDLLIATDCISEGQNLQDCDYLVNYDIHWNPVRIIQRFGRIDRIGSYSKDVQMVNFWPMLDLDKYINLKFRVEAKMAMVDLAATASDNPLEDIKKLIEDDLTFRDKQLLRLQTEILDMDDFNETLNISEFTLDDFRLEILNYLKINPNHQALKESPMGLYAVAPTDNRFPSIRPGVLFCLRQEGINDENLSINPLQPYFLVYVLEDGNIRYGFTSPKQLLDIMRTLCSGKSDPYPVLCQWFDNLTQSGESMQPFNKLLESAMISIQKSYHKRLVELANTKGFTIPPVSMQISEKTQFELITWLVIKDEHTI
jgi:SNF2 family DNA or RNA helicase